jgi:type IV secretion system protein VirB10
MNQAGNATEDISGRVESSYGRSADSVAGERGIPTVNSIRSMQSRISSFLAAGLMIVLGVGALSWYYSNALSRQKRERQAAIESSARKAQGEMALPPLGYVEPPRAGASAAESASSELNAAAPQRRPNASGDLALPTASDLPLEQSHVTWQGAGASVAPYSATDPSGSPQRQTPSDRRLSGAAFARDSMQPAAPALAPGEGQGADAALIATGRTVANPLPGASLPGTRSEDSLGALLRPGMATPARAQTLPTQQFLLPKGAFIDCTLETAIDSTLPGMTTCITATDTFGVDGKVVLLERGSKLVGETRGEVQNGSSRVFVLWTEARTPTGVLVPLDSPGTDELGRSGLPGEVNRHFWDRFGAAMLISVIDGAMQAAVQASSRSNSAIIYNPSASQDALTDVLKGTINIAPSVIKHQGDRIQILVARDLDFRPVYELRAAGL